MNFLISFCAYFLVCFRPAEDGSAAARSLLQCMQVQCKIYEEWLEVMSDYSTVFCDDRRGVAEHYYGSHSNSNNNDNIGTAEDGEGKDGSSTVRFFHSKLLLFPFAHLINIIRFCFVLFLILCRFTKEEPGPCIFV